MATGRTLSLAAIFWVAGSCQVVISQSAQPNDPTVHAGQLNGILDRFAEERDRRYMDMFKGLASLMDQRFSDQATALAAASVASEKAISMAFAASERATTSALTSAKEAVAKAEIAADKRFERIDEISTQIKDLGLASLPRTEYASEFNVLQSRMEAIETEVSRIVGALLLVAAVLPLASGLVVFFVSKRFRDRDAAGPAPRRGYERDVS
jgi:hypothetical protein